MDEPVEKDDSRKKGCQKAKFQESLEGFDKP